MGVPQKLWFIVESPIQMDDLGVPPFQETTGTKWIITMVIDPLNLA